MMRTDDAEIIGGLRLNVWVSIVVFLGALAFFLLRKGPQEFVVPVTEGKGFQTVTEAEFLAYKADAPSSTAATDEPAPNADERAPAADDPAPNADEANDDERVEHDATASKD